MATESSSEPLLKRKPAYLATTYQGDSVVVLLQPAQYGARSGEVGSRGRRDRVLQGRGQLLRELQSARPGRPPRTTRRRRPRRSAASFCSREFLKIEIVF